jgi:iron complex outermembrane receptor protein
LLEEVVVLARKREERLHQVPLSVQAFSGAALENQRIDNVENLVGKVPNLSLSSNLLSPGGDFINIAVRGVGAQSAGTPAVGTFVDGAFVPSLSFDIGFLDVERVEVLRGPQGTLFGRNTQGGALNIVLKRPDEETRGKVAVTLDEFDSYRAQAAVSGALSDQLFGNIAIDISTTDGYLKNPVVANAAGAQGNGRAVSANDQHRAAWRTALRYIPNDNLDINLAIDGSRRTGLDGLPGVPRGTEDYIVRSEFQIDAEYENHGGALNIEYQLGEIELTAITAYRKVSSALPFDFDGSPERGPNIQAIYSEQELLSQELRFSGSQGDSIDWIFGAYAFQEESLTQRSIQFNDLVFGALLVDAQDHQLARSGYALFGDFVWHATDNLEINAGIRFAEETVGSDVVLDFIAPAIGLAVDETGSGSIDDSNVSPTIAVRYDLNDDISAYARYAKGFRAGGFPAAPANAATNISFDSESSDNYEVGIKGSVLDGQLQFDLALYQIDITDQQLTTLVFINDDPNLPVASVDNAGESRSRGFEASLTYRPSAALEIGTVFGHTDAEYLEYTDTAGVDRSGEPFPFVPEWTAQAHMTYSTTIGEWGLDMTARYRYVDEILSGSGVDIDLQFEVDSYDVIDLNATLSRDNWSIDVFVDNVTDDFIETRVFNAFFFAAPRPFSQVLPPRRAGIRIAYDF